MRSVLLLLSVLMLTGCTEQKWKHRFLTDSSTKELVKVCRDGPANQTDPVTPEQFRFCMENFGFYQINE